MRHMIHLERQTSRRYVYNILRRYHLLARAYLWLRHVCMTSIKWWHKNNRHYGVWWRVGNAVAAGLMITAVVLPVTQDIFVNNSYHLNAESLKLVGQTDERLAKQLSYDSQQGTYQFNKGAIKDGSTNPAQQLKTQIGTASGAQKDMSLYSLDVASTFSKGITFHDVNSGLSFDLKPNFTGRDGRETDKHLVFPLSSGMQAVYTLKNNGLKEDIVVPKVAGESLSFSYTLNVPKTRVAKPLPD